MGFSRTLLVLAALQLSNLVVAESHQSNIYSGAGCQMDSYEESIYNFGCGGHCYSYPNGVESIYLQYDGGKTKPTVDCYPTDDCKGNRVIHAGIASGKDGCTENFGRAFSCYFYYGS